MKPMALIGKKNPVLTQVALPVADDEDMQRIIALAERMLATCRVKGGIAIAAPQVGVSKRIVVTWDGHVWVNPEIEPDDEETEDDVEGCLSIPGRLYKVNRPTRCSLSAIDLGGLETTVDLDGLEARMIQHEVDHLDGILIWSRGKEIANGGMGAMKY